MCTKCEKAKTSKKPLEFMQKILIAMYVASIVYTSFSYILAFLGKDTVEALSATIVTTLWTADAAASLGYIIQNSVRAWSKNKYDKPTTRTKTGGNARGDL